MSEPESFPIGVMHRGIRFHLGKQRDTLRLLFMMVRDSRVTVDEALACFRFDDDTSEPQLEGKPDER